jgi:hypothetical protein
VQQRKPRIAAGSALAIAGWAARVAGSIGSTAAVTAGPQRPPRQQNTGKPRGTGLRTLS